jgi:hypothetical protein
MIRRLVMIAMAALLANAALAQSANEVSKARDEIWAKEKAIYAGRAKGDTSYYYENSSVDFLAWVYGTPKPFRRDSLAASRATMRTQDKEQLTNEFKDFSLHGDTAIIYYVNHRTMKPDGTPVDQYFDNIHVWVREGGTWKVLASMSRLQTPGATPGAPPTRSTPPGG